MVLLQYYHLQSGDTSDNTINIISKGLNFINTIDNSNQLIIMGLALLWSKIKKGKNALSFASPEKEN